MGPNADDLVFGLVGNPFVAAELAFLTGFQPETGRGVLLHQVGVHVDKFESGTED